MGKKVRGKLHYFGPWADPDGALKKWLDVKDDLLAGRQPRPRAEDGIALRDVANAFLTAKSAAYKSGELSGVLFSKYYDSCARLLAHFGPTRLVSDLRPTDFGAYRDILAAKWGPVTVGCEIQRVRTAFKFAFENGVIPVPVLFGTMFQKPSRSVVRVHKSKQPRKLFAPDEIHALLKATEPTMAAMILLGINCGWGNSDVAGVRLSHLDLKRGIAIYPRAKTGVDRRATLWPETVKAIEKALAARPAPKAEAEADADLVFITRYGNPWRRSSASVDADEAHRVRWQNVDSVGLEFGKLLRAVHVKRDGKPVTLKREGVNFYTLRHCFKTTAEGAGDIPAVNRIMGHEDADDVGTHYRQWTGDAAEDMRLRKVTDHVHAWLFGKGRAKRRGKAHATASRKSE